MACKIILRHPAPRNPVYDGHPLILILKDMPFRQCAIQLTTLASTPEAFTFHPRNLWLRKLMAFWKSKYQTSILFPLSILNVTSPRKLVTIVRHEGVCEMPCFLPSLACLPPSDWLSFRARPLQGFSAWVFSFHSCLYSLRYPPV